jgi:hypothetical protein
MIHFFMGFGFGRVFGYPTHTQYPTQAFLKKTGYDKNPTEPKTHKKWAFLSVYVSDFKRKKNRKGHYELFL